MEERAAPACQRVANVDPRGRLYVVAAIFLLTSEEYATLKLVGAYLNLASSLLILSVAPIMAKASGYKKILDAAADGPG